MRNFSWHSEPGLAPHWYKIYGWLPNRYLPIVMFGDSIPIYKPNMKGGHRHNHIYNVCNRITFRGKKSRRVKPADKKYFVSIFWENIALMPDVLNKILANKRKSNDQIHL